MLPKTHFAEVPISPVLAERAFTHVCLRKVGIHSFLMNLMLLAETFFQSPRYVSSRSFKETIDKESYRQISGNSLEKKLVYMYIIA